MSEARIWCDRCGAVLITNEDDMGEALDDNGWTGDDFGDFTCGNCHLADVLNCDDTSGEATDAAALAVHQLRVRAEKAEAAIARVREVCDKDSFFLNHTNGGSGRGLTVAQVLAALEGDKR